MIAAPRRGRGSWNWSGTGNRPPARSPPSSTCPSLAISQHLHVLKSAGFLIERRAGNSRVYRADQAALGPLRAVVEDHWRAGLDRLKELAETEHAKQQDTAS